jgi:DNA primase
MNERFLQDLKSRVDLVDIVGQYSPLKRSGKNYSCRSPFRDERTPSFSVSPDKQVWYDFGASEGGDVISFIEKIENCSFVEAIQFLSDKVGMEIPQQSSKQQAKDQERKSLKVQIYQLHSKATEFFTKQLSLNKVVQKYLSNRKISQETITKWRLGYGGDGVSDCTEYLLQSGFSEDLITKSGVAFSRNFGEKKMADRFAKRLIIPINEARNEEIIAFGGRDLSGEKKVAKYLNSPENPVYEKSLVLFGLDKARKSIIKQEKVIIVEGYFDVISAHENGLDFTVGTCGTALTDSHLRILKRMTKQIYLAFDSDLAGKKATLRAVEICLKNELTPWIIFDDNGKDFDELVRDGKDLSVIFSQAENAMEFLIKGFAKKNLQNGIEGRKKFLDSVFYFLKLVTRPIEIDDLLELIALKLNKSKALIESEFLRFKSSQKTRLKSFERTSDKKLEVSHQAYFVGFILSNGKRFKANFKKEWLDIITENFPGKILKKWLNSEQLTEDEQKKTQPWELASLNTQEEFSSEEHLQDEFDSYIKRFSQDFSHQKLLEKAQKIRGEINK